MQIIDALLCWRSAHASGTPLGEPPSTRYTAQATQRKAAQAGQTAGLRAGRDPPAAETFALENVATGTRAQATPHAWPPAAEIPFAVAAQAVADSGLVMLKSLLWWPLQATCTGEYSTGRSYCRLSRSPEGTPVIHLCTGAASATFSNAILCLRCGCARDAAAPGSSILAIQP